ncbi:MAG: DUF4314 domain-containing protein [Eubacteriales bacterium]|nr:DUF4314 domain-containing protein [Eubacteriales bacterium]
MIHLSRAQVERIYQQYPPGTEVELIAMPEDLHPVPPGTRGKVLAVDDAGQELKHIWFREKQEFFLDLFWNIRVRMEGLRKNGEDKVYVDILWEIVDI